MMQQLKLVYYNDILLALTNMNLYYSNFWLVKWRCQVFRGGSIIIIGFILLLSILDFTKWSVTAAYWHGGKSNVAHFGLYKYYRLQDFSCGAWKGTPWSCYNIIKVLLAISSDHLYTTARNSCTPPKCNFKIFFGHVFDMRAMACALSLDLLEFLTVNHG